MTDQSATDHRRRFLRPLLLNRIVLLVFGLIIGGVVLELSLRALFATRVGAEVLLFGTPYCCGPAQMITLDRERGARHLAEESFAAHPPEVEIAGYRKYGPGQTRQDYTVEGESFEVRINSRGFRGEDFEEEAAPGVSRVVTLGSSSTFGYRSPDDATYPVVMERLLNQRLHEALANEAEASEGIEAFEVLNLGIPYLWSGQILSLLESEALALRPDVVTLYAGMNDAKPAARYRKRPNEYRLVWIEGDPSLLERVYRRTRRPLAALSRYFVTASLVRSLVPERGAFDAEQLELYSTQKADEFIANVAEIRRAAEAGGAVFIVANQQVHHSNSRLPARGVTYGESVAELRGELEAGRLLTLLEVDFLTHSRLMERLRSWCRENAVPFVDVIAALDRRRDLLASYNHLTPAGNRIVGEALAAEVWNQLFQGAGAPTDSL